MKAFFKVLLVLGVVILLLVSLSAVAEVSLTAGNPFAGTLESILVSLGGIGDSIARLFERAVPRF